MEKITFESLKNELMEKKKKQKSRKQIIFCLEMASIVAVLGFLQKIVLEIHTFTPYLVAIGMLFILSAYMIFAFGVFGTKPKVDREEVILYSSQLLNDCFRLSKKYLKSSDPDDAKKLIDINKQIEDLRIVIGFSKPMN